MIPRTAPIATPLGLVIDSAGEPHPVVKRRADGALHVAFQLVGSIMSNRVSRAPVYHATFH